MRQLPQAPAGLVIIHAGHAAIAGDEIEPRLAGHLECGAPAVRDLHLADQPSSNHE
jgi:hypothetical protein